MHTAAENLKEIVASTLNSLCWWIGHQTYWGVFAWTRGMYHTCVIYVSYMNALNALSILDLPITYTCPSSVVVKGLSW